MQFDMRMIQQMQNRLMRAQEELGNEIVTGTAGGGAVTVEVSGLREVKSISIKPEAVDPDDISMLEDLIMLAINDGMTRAQELASERMGGITGGLNIPGLM